LFYDLTINWQHIFQILFIPLCIQIAALGVGIFLNKIINRKLNSKLALKPESIQYVFVNALRGMSISWCSGVGLYWTIHALDIPATVQQMLSYILFTVIIFTLTRVIARTLVGMIDMQTKRNSPEMPKTSLLTNTVNIIIYAMGILVILQSYGISITPIITALGVGGMALALGLQETLTNIFSGLHLILSKQLRLGDYIELSTGEIGCVKDITWRFTSIQSLSNNIIIVPNQKIASAILTNYSMPKQDISVRIAVGVSYDSDLDKVERITLEVAREIMQLDKGAMNHEPSISFHTFAEYSINFNVFLRASQFSNQYMLKHEFIKALTKRYRKENIVIPFPVRTIHQENNPPS